MKNHEWIELISSEFHCSKSCAREMLHAMYEAKRYKEVSSNSTSKKSMNESTFFNDGWCSNICEKSLDKLNANW